MGTRLIIGAVLIVLAIIGIAVCYLVTHNPKPPKWASEMFIGSVILPLVVGAIFMGPMLVGEAMLYNFHALDFSDVMVALSILVAGVLALLMIRIPKRLEAYEALRSAVEVPEERKKGRKAEPQLGTLRHGA